MLLTRSIRLKVSGGEIALLCGRCAGRVTVRVLLTLYIRKAAAYTEFTGIGSETGN